MIQRKLTQTLGSYTPSTNRRPASPLHQPMYSASRASLPQPSIFPRRTLGSSNEGLGIAGCTPRAGSEGLGEERLQRSVRSTSVRWIGLDLLDGRKHG